MASQCITISTAWVNGTPDCSIRLLKGKTQRLVATKDPVDTCRGKRRNTNVRTAGHFSKSEGAVCVRGRIRAALFRTNHLVTLCDLARSVNVRNCTQITRVREKIRAGLQVRPVERNGCTPAVGIVKCAGTTIGLGAVCTLVLKHYLMHAACLAFIRSARHCKIRKNPKRQVLQSDIPVFIRKNAFGISKAHSFVIFVRNIKNLSGFCALYLNNKLAAFFLTRRQVNPGNRCYGNGVALVFHNAGRPHITLNRSAGTLRLQHPSQQHQTGKHGRTRNF